MENQTIMTSRTFPTCTRCRHHGVSNVRVLQHDCPFKCCSCSNCLLIRALKTLGVTRPDSQKKAKNSQRNNSSHIEQSKQSDFDPDQAEANTCTQELDFHSLCYTFPNIPPSILQEKYDMPTTSTCLEQTKIVHPVDSTTNSTNYNTGSLHINEARSTSQSCYMHPINVWQQANLTSFNAQDNRTAWQSSTTTSVPIAENSKYFDSNWQRSDITFGQSYRLESNNAARLFQNESRVEWASDQATNENHNFDYTENAENLKPVPLEIDISAPEVTGNILYEMIDACFLPVEQPSTLSSTSTSPPSSSASSPRPQSAPSVTHSVSNLLSSSSSDTWLHHH